MQRQAGLSLAYLVAEAVLRREYPAADPMRIDAAATGAESDLARMPDVSLTFVRAAGQATQLALRARSGRPFAQLSADRRRDLVTGLAQVAAPGIGEYLRAVGSLALLNFHNQDPENGGDDR